MCTLWRRIGGVRGSLPVVLPPSRLLVSLLAANFDKAALHNGPIFSGRRNEGPPSSSSPPFTPHVASPSQEGKKDSPSVPDELGKVHSVLESSVVNYTVCFVNVLHLAKQKSNPGPPSKSEGHSPFSNPPLFYRCCFLIGSPSFLRLLPALFPEPLGRGRREETHYSRTSPLMRTPGRV